MSSDSSSRRIRKSDFATSDGIDRVDLTLDTIRDGINHTYSTLGAINETLVDNGSERMAEIVELAGFSSMLGDLLTSGVAQSSSGVFTRNAPHTFPDLLHNEDENKGVEVKIALEDNQPKGHLVKPGYYLTFRYVLADKNKDYTRNERGNTAYIWEVRFGYLDDSCFNTSDTDGDSGKTATISAGALDGMSLLLCDFDLFPYSKSRRGTKYKEYWNDVNGGQPNFFE
jgi:hypothetical protein